MKISSVSLNKINTIKSLNNYKSPNINNSEKIDVVSFTGKELPGKREIIAIQNSYRPQIKFQRSAKQAIKTCIKGAFSRESEINPFFVDDVSAMVTQRITQSKASPEMKKSSFYKAIGIFDDFYGFIVNSATLDPERYYVPNAVAVVSKDKKLANKFIDAICYKSKEVSSLCLKPSSDFDNYMRKVGPLSLIDYKKIPDKFANVEDLQEAIHGALESAKEKFDKENIRTILHVENIEPAISKNNSSQNLACMRDLLSSSWEDFRTVLVFNISDSKKYDTGSIMAHRVGHVYDIDAAAIKSSDILKLNATKTNLEASADRISKVIRKQYPLYEETISNIKDFQEQCRKEVEAVKIKFPKKRNRCVKVKPSEVVEKTLSKNKKLAIAFSSLAAVGVVAGALYKKYVNNKAEKNNAQKNQQSKSQISKPVAPLSTIPVAKTSSVFSEFQKTV